MDELSLEIEALRAIYSDKELTIETRDNCQIIHIQLIKEAKNEVSQVEDDDQILKFVKINVAFLINPGYPEESPPEIHKLNVCILDGKYQMNECPIENYQTDDSGTIAFDDSTSIFINVDEIINYYNTIKESYIGRVCLFDIIENLQAFIDDNTYKYISSQESQDDKDSESQLSEVEEVVYSGLTERYLCPVEERVTEEQFNLWKIAFKAEMIEKKIWKDESQDSTQLTGKQLFEKDETLIKSDDHIPVATDSTDI
ncbi:hypothetical protein OIY81_2272 [Cryptosporidium canis]|uniref:RWD domain-containing protein n=1 Tax=Cryptosporidium canis TaxID=195482 RepID=A0ABQ8P9Q6_9CRYT|nr:hypothetical protein OIY81_2272 [Cryptosporidium canis]KAJ1610423.1 hypothetical protein OJ252_1931 [Cryptosporidium canis]